MECKIAGLHRRMDMELDQRKLHDMRKYISGGCDFPIRHVCRRERLAE